MSDYSPEQDEETTDEQVVADTELAKGPYEQFYERNKEGIQYVQVSTRTYYISRRWTLRGPVPVGARIEHTGISGYRDGNMYNADGSKREYRERSGGTHSKGPLWRRNR